MILTIEELEKAIRGYLRIPILEFWALTEPDPGGMIGGGGDNYLAPNGYFVYSAYEACRWNTEEEAKTSAAWIKYQSWNGYKIVKVSHLTEQPRKFSEEEIKVLLLDLLSHKLLIKDLITPKQ